MRLAARVNQERVNARARVRARVRVRFKVRVKGRCKARKRTCCFRADERDCLMGGKLDEAG